MQSEPCPFEGRFARKLAPLLGKRAGARHLFGYREARQAAPALQKCAASLAHEVQHFATSLGSLALLGRRAGARHLFGYREERQAAPALQKCAAKLAHEVKSLPLRWGRCAPR